jgi:hypothetical protein
METKWRPVRFLGQKKGYGMTRNLLIFFGAPGATRTHGTQIRNLFIDLSPIFP